MKEWNVMECLASKEGGCWYCGGCEQKCVVIPDNANFLAELITKALCYCDACAFPSSSKSYQKQYQLCLTSSCIQPIGELLFAVVVGINESSAFNRAKQIKADNYLVWDVLLLFQLLPFFDGFFWPHRTKLGFYHLGWNCIRLTTLLSWWVYSSQNWHSNYNSHQPKCH